MAQTGGASKHWLYDPQSIDSIGPILSKLVVYDTYFQEEEGQTTLQIVLDKILEELPDELEEAVRMIYLAGMSHRSAARTIGVDHKTSKARADKGIKILKKQLTDTVWLTSLLNGVIPKDEEVIKANSPEKIFNVLNNLSTIRSKVND